jgi:hypothetical protein
LIGVPVVPVAVRIGVTVPDPLLTTKACLPSGVMAIAFGNLPTVIA